MGRNTLNKYCLITVLQKQSGLTTQWVYVCTCTAPNNSFCVLTIHLHMQILMQPLSHICFRAIYQWCGKDFITFMMYGRSQNTPPNHDLCCNSFSEWDSSYRGSIYRTQFLSSCSSLLFSVFALIAITLFICHHFIHFSRLHYKQLVQAAARCERSAMTVGFSSGIITQVGGKEGRKPYVSSTSSWLKSVFLVKRPKENFKINEKEELEQGVKTKHACV